MTITLKLSTDQERRLREGTRRHDAAAMRRVLLQAVETTVENLLREPPPQPEPVTFRALLDALAAELPDALHLSETALSRDSIYEDPP